MLNMNDDDETIKNRNEKTLLEQYSQPQQNPQVQNVQRQVSSVGADTAEEFQFDPNLFRGVTFAMFGFSEESTLELLAEIDESGGSTIGVNDFSTIADYLIVPVDTYEISDCHFKAKEIVNDLWIVSKFCC